MSKPVVKLLAVGLMVAASGFGILMAHAQTASSTAGADGAATGGAPLGSVAASGRPAADPVSLSKCQEAFSKSLGASGGTAAGASVSNGPYVDGSAPPAYLTGAARIVDSEIDDFLVNPCGTLAVFPTGGVQMTLIVASLAGSDSRTVAALVSAALLPEAGAGQVSSIGAGLAAATKAAPDSAAPYAAYIQSAVAQSGSPRLIASFERATSDDATAALGGAGAGAGGSPGSGSLTGGGPIGTSGALNGDDVVPTRAGSSASLPNRGSISYNVTRSGFGGVNGGATDCDDDVSIAGCV